MSEAKGGAPRKGELVPLTVRFTREAYDAIREIANENNISTAALVRIAVDMEIDRYLSLIRFLDYGMEKQVKDSVRGLFTETQKVLFELRRIGVNFNQQARLYNLKKSFDREMKNAPAGSRIDLMQRQMAMEKQIQAECKPLDMEKLEELIARFEAASREVNKVICRILP